ncbi:MAG TPA: UDP-N-acetylglucosamine 2-epimerase [Elusimicrobiota bacterium]|nr:UDP-N-acetylglucosamine 2-epimerase [Elusimicrobiota bacterium]
MTMKIAVFTGTRAEYGLFRPLLVEMSRDRSVRAALIVSGTHLSSRYGDTHREIRADGFSIHETVRIPTSTRTEEDIARALSAGLVGCVRALKRLDPDFLVLLGDRFETFACAVAGYLLKIPIAHLHGGELTEGVADEAWRHSITKMSHLHFTSNAEYRRRVIQLGESPDRVFNVGALGIDNIRSVSRIPRTRLERDIGFSFGPRSVLVTFHPETLRRVPAGDQIDPLLKSLESFPDLRVLFTASNADVGGRAIMSRIDGFVRAHPGRSVCVPSLGAARYLSAVSYVDAVVGNSSSGIIEAPSLGTPTVNVGDRQKGRLMAPSVINCRGDEPSIRAAIRQALSVSFQKRCSRVRNPYGDGRTARRIVAVLKRFSGRIKTVQKPFYDVPMFKRTERG